LPGFIAAQESELIMAIPDNRVFSEDLWLVTHAELTASARVRAVADFLVEIAAEAGLLSSTR